MHSRYEILNQLGEGGEASVWKAWDTKLQRYVAIKRLLPPSLRETPDAGDIFAEASALSALQHPNIVSVFDVEKDDETGPYVVMEFLNGENLEQTVQRGGLTQEDFISITTQVLEGLVAAHKLGMQHRDIKPSNLMLTWLPDQRFVAKLLDFGLAKFSTRPTQQTVKGNNRILGSIFFMAPEQFSHHPLDYRSDLYSLGCVLYFALTTRHPFAGETPSKVMQSHLDHMVAPLRDIRPDIKLIFCDWVMWLLRRQPEHRPKDAAFALETFRGLVSGELTELPTRSTGLRTATVMPTKKVSLDAPPAHLPASKTAQVPKKRKLKIPVLAGVIGLLIIGAIAAVMVMNNKPAVEEMGPSPHVSSPEPPPVATSKKLASPNTLPPAPPVTLGLVVWLDGEVGTLGLQDKPADFGGPVSRWMDLEEDRGGNTDFTTSADAAAKKQTPVLTKIKNQHGLVGEHNVVRFNGNQFLNAQQREGKPRIADGTLDGREFTIFTVMRADVAMKKICRVISAKCGAEPKAWDLCVDSTRIQGGVRLPDGKSNKAEIKLNRMEGFAVVQFIRDGSRNWGKLYLTKSVGETQLSNPIPTKQDSGPLQALRLGAMSEYDSEEEADYFSGEMAILLIYNRPLGDPDRESVASYLLKRFMNR